MFRGRTVVFATRVATGIQTPRHHEENIKFCLSAIPVAWRVTSTGTNTIYRASHFPFIHLVRCCYSWHLLAQRFWYPT